MATGIIGKSFVTLDEIRRHLQVPLEDVEVNGRLMDIANSVAVGLESITGRVLKQQAYSNVLMAGEGTDVLALPNYPVATTPAPVVTISTARDFDNETPLVFWNNDSGQDGTAAEFVAADADAGLLQRVDGGVFPRAPNSILVSYTGGMPEAEWEPLREASLLLCGYYFHGEGRDLTLTNLAMGGISRAWRDSGIPARAREIVMRYSHRGFSL